MSAPGPTTSGSNGKIQSFKNLLVTKIPRDVSDTHLLAIFWQFGALSAKVMVDATTGYSKGFGFVVLPSEEQGRWVQENYTRRPIIVESSVNELLLGPAGDDAGVAAQRAKGPSFAQQLATGRIALPPQASYEFIIVPSEHDDKAAARPSEALFVRNVPLSYTSEQVEELMRTVGTPVFCSVRADDRHGIWIVYCEFDSLDGSASALARLHGMRTQPGFPPIIAKYADNDELKKQRRDRRRETHVEGTKAVHTTRIVDGNGNTAPVEGRHVHPVPRDHFFPSQGPSAPPTGTALRSADGGGEWSNRQSPSHASGGVPAVFGEIGTPPLGTGGGSPPPAGMVAASSMDNPFGVAKLSPSAAAGHDTMFFGSTFGAPLLPLPTGLELVSPVPSPHHGSGGAHAAPIIWVPSPAASSTHGIPSSSRENSMLFHRNSLGSAVMTPSGAVHAQHPVMLSAAGLTSAAHLPGYQFPSPNASSTAATVYNSHYASPQAASAVNAAVFGAGGPLTAPAFSTLSPQSAAAYYAHQQAAASLLQQQHPQHLRPQTQQPNPFQVPPQAGAYHDPTAATQGQPSPYFFYPDPYAGQRAAAGVAAGSNQGALDSLQAAIAAQGAPAVVLTLPPHAQVRAKQNQQNHHTQPPPEASTAAKATGEDREISESNNNNTESDPLLDRNGESDRSRPSPVTNPQPQSASMHKVPPIQGGNSGNSSSASVQHSSTSAVLPQSESSLQSDEDTRAAASAAEAAATAQRNLQQFQAYLAAHYAAQQTNQPSQLLGKQQGNHFGRNTGQSGSHHHNQQQQHSHGRGRGGHHYQHQAQQQAQTTGRNQWISSSSPMTQAGAGMNGAPPTTTSPGHVQGFGVFQQQQLYAHQHAPSSVPSQPPHYAAPQQIS